MAEKEQTSSITKHIDIKKHHIREVVLSGSINIVTLSSEHQVADTLTKVVSDANEVSHSQQLLTSSHCSCEKYNQSIDICLLSLLTEPKHSH